MLTNWSQGNLSSDDFAPGDCTATDASGKSVPIMTNGSVPLATKTQQPASITQNQPTSAPAPTPTPPLSPASATGVILEAAANNAYLEGSSYEISWGTPSWAPGLPVSLELYRGVAPCSYNNRYGPTYKACGIEIGSAPIYTSDNNTGSYEWQVPLNLTGGGYYSIVLFFNGAISGQSALFSIQ